MRQHVEAVRGTADNPMPREEVLAKCRDLVAPVLGAAKAASLIEHVLGTERMKHMGELRPLLQKG